jgi:hypothetical protein
MNINTFKSIAITIFFSSLIISCNNVANDKSNNVTDNTTNDEHHHNESEAIELNNGKKWQVDKNMLIHIRNMEKDVVSFTDSQLNNYQDLAKKLQINLDLLTSNCTMKGKAHDELHKWLLPYIDLVKTLSETKDETSAAEQYENIKTSFNTFNQYFQ